MAFLGLFERKRYERAGFELYTAAVQAARDPYIFETLRVPDTLDGRFDVIGLYVFLVVNRLHAESKVGKDLAQAVFDAMFSDMDINLREIGVSDMRIGKRVRAMWEAFNGRSTAYAAAVEAGDTAALTEAVARNVWRGDAPENAANALAALMLDQAAHLRRQPIAALAAGRVEFRPAWMVA
jgi:cytochrome b pre-mRNA-processing protein 3